MLFENKTNRVHRKSCDLISIPEQIYSSRQTVPLTLLVLECRSWGPLESFPLGFGFIVASIFVNVIRFAQQIYVAKVTLTVLQNRLNNANRFSHGRGHVWLACTNAHYTG
jgi:hypothetical protein